MKIWWYWSVLLGRFERVMGLVGDEHFAKLQKLKIIIFGVGGVGSFCLDCLYRSGVSDITIVDFDRYDVSNQNRQIGSDAVGEYKTEHLATLYPNIHFITTRITPEWVEGFDFGPYDFVVDAIDDVNAKLALIEKAHEKMISSLGSAKKLDPTKIIITDIFKTENDPLARKIRTELRKRRFKHKLKVVASNEVSHTVKKGSFVGVTGAFGLTICSYILQKTL